MSGVWETLLTWLFPHKCFGCGELVGQEAFVCEECAQQLPWAKGGCPRCGKRVRACVCSQLEALDGAGAPLWYEGIVRQGIHRYKYSGRQYYATFLGALMADCFRERMSGLGLEAIVYIPLHPRKQRQRGFCQTQRLAAKVSEATGLPVLEEVLLHTGRGKAQMSQRTFEDRRKNAARSFDIWEDVDLTGKRLLLIDDVFTSGRTLDTCARLLKEQGAERVWGLTAAITRSSYG